MILDYYNPAILDFYSNFKFMKVSFNWLKEFVNLPADISLEEVGARLTMATVEVEKVIDLGKELNGIYVGQINNIIKSRN